MTKLNYQNKVEKWGLLEVRLTGPNEGNPFAEQTIKGVFTGKNETVSADGFYDGDGIYKVRFMPSFEGRYTFKLTCSFTDQCLTGEFDVVPAKPENHGPMRVVNTYHFAYEDGTPYYSVGTTCYVWHLQSDDRIAQTLATLENSAFNKIRFCLFPKHYDYNLGEPRDYPYQGKPMDSSVLTEENFLEYQGKAEGNDWDFQRFNPRYFQHIEDCILKLQKLGIEADLIVMHPYDRWGFSEMTKAEDDFYWNYIIARFSAYRNIWWSLANEYDLLEHKNISDWERYAALLCKKDPYNHLRSIHNCRTFYDYRRPWITHCSVQRIDLYKCAELVKEWRETYRKPIVLDEIVYEGNIQHGWGNINGEELTRRFWEAACRGGYPGHGETFMNPDRILWWSHGGRLHGESYQRFQFLYDIMCETPGIGLRPYENGRWDEVCAVPEESPDQGQEAKDYYLIYFGFMCPSFREYYFDDETKFEINVLDTWNMTVERQGVFQGKFRIELPGRPYMAIQMKAIK